MCACPVAPYVSLLALTIIDIYCMYRHLYISMLTVPSTAKGTKRVELNSLQNVDWLTNHHFCVIQGMKLLLHSFRSAVHECWAYLHQSAQTQKNITVYFIILYCHTDNSRFSNMCYCLFLRTCETSLPKNPHHFQNITVIVSWNVVLSFSSENVVV